MPDTVEYRQHILIRGPGLDEVLEPGRKIVLLDDFYADMYGDYVFLGYDALAETIEAGRADYVGLLAAALLLEGEPGVVVCGDKPDTCLLALAAHMVYKDSLGPEEALRRAARLLARLYGEEPRVGVQGVTGLMGIYASINALGGGAEAAKKLSILLSLAANYEYGRGRLHYGEHVSWLAALNAGREAQLAGLLHFLAEGPGEPRKLLEARLDAIGEERLLAVLGRPEKRALEVLRDYVSLLQTGAARLLALVEALGPGEPHLVHLERRGSKLLVYCMPGSQGEPSRECVAAVEKASKLIPLKEAGIESIRISTGLHSTASPAG